MMKGNNRLLMKVLVALVIGAVAGCASSLTQESTGQYTAITAKVKTAIFNDPGLKSLEINVETFKGVAQLSGFASSRDDINRAVEIARNVDGVTSVKNDMQLK
jgi:osmotically-inducible protein OsmY